MRSPLRFLLLPSLVTLWSVAPPIGAANAPPAFEQLMTLLAQRRHGEADFQELRYLALLDRPLASSGVLIYDAPDHLEERILQPRRQSALLDHGMLTLRIGKRERSLPLAQYPQLAPLIESVRALLAGDRAALEQLFELQFSGTLEHWHLQLEPRAARLAATVRALDISGHRADIDVIEMRARNGDHSIMRIEPRP